jgi:hypothetical protein
MSMRMGGTALSEPSLQVAGVCGQVPSRDARLQPEGSRSGPCIAGVDDGREPQKFDGESRHRRIPRPSRSRQKLGDHSRRLVVTGTPSPNQRRRPGLPSWPSRYIRQEGGPSRVGIATRADVGIQIFGVTAKASRHAQRIRNQRPAVQLRPLPCAGGDLLQVRPRQHLLRTRVRWAAAARVEAKEQREASADPTRPPTSCGSPAPLPDPQVESDGPRFPRDGRRRHARRDHARAELGGGRGERR